jgi:hypothetical protein
MPSHRAARAWRSPGGTAKRSALVGVAGKQVVRTVDLDR